MRHTYIIYYIHSNLSDYTFLCNLLDLQGYKVYYTTNPNQPEASWDSQMVDNSELTTISELTPHAIYTVRVQAYTSMGAGPMSTPVQVKTQQGECVCKIEKSLSRFLCYGVSNEITTKIKKKLF